MSCQEVIVQLVELNLCNLRHLSSNSPLPMKKRKLKCLNIKCNMRGFEHIRSKLVIFSH